MQIANGTVGAPAGTAKTHGLVTLRSPLSVAPKRLVLNEQEHLVAPVVLIVEGVLNHGLVPGEELDPERWQGVWVTVGHPQDPDGMPISARQPQVLSQCAVGHLFNCERSVGRRAGHPVVSLRGELWINMAMAARCGAEADLALKMLEDEQQLEVSTAFFCSSEPVSGTFYGESYHEIHRQLRPDHLALLPQDVGACDWHAGCGAPRLNAATLTYESVTPCACPDPAACQCHEGESPMALTDAPARGWRGFVEMLRRFVDREAPQASEPQEPEEPTPLRGEDAAEEDTAEEEDDAAVPAAAPVPVPEPFPSGDLVSQALTQARHPTFRGTERTSWSAPSLSECVRAMGGDATMAAMSVAAMPMAMKRRVAALSLLGDPAADNVRDLLLFPVVNPRTQHVNEHALRAVLGGRGSQANVSAEALTSARRMARRLLTSEFGANLATEAQETAMPPTMTNTKKRWVDALITNAQLSWTEDDRATLDQMDEALLIRMVQDAKRLSQEPEAEPQTIEEAVNLLPAHLREGMRAQMRSYERHKQALIEQIMTNEHNPYPRERLEKMDDEFLTGLIRFSGDPLPGEQPQKGANYGGRRLPHIRVVTDDEEIPEPPRVLELVVERQKAMGLR